MKVVNLITLLLLIGCSTNEPSPAETLTEAPAESAAPEYAEIDSIIEASKINVVRNDSINKVSERIIAKKVDQTVYRIEALKSEVEQAKLISSKVITKTDTVYIETKKNFWGKARTTTSIKSDSSIEEIVDTLNNQNQFRL